MGQHKELCIYIFFCGPFYFAFLPTLNVGRLVPSLPILSYRVMSRGFKGKSTNFNFSFYIYIDGTDNVFIAGRYL